MAEILRDKVERELARYDHPLFRFRMEEPATAVWLHIDLREGPGVKHHYGISLHERESENPQFAWTFQKLLYDCPHDFIFEMFERNPQLRE